MADRRKQRTPSGKVRALPELVLEKRHKLTPAQRKKLVSLKGTICKWCSQALADGESWIDEHWTPLALGGKNSWDNRFPLHIQCAKEKTRLDQRAIAKAKRTRRKHLGQAPASRNPMPGGRGTGWKVRLTASGRKAEKRRSSISCAAAS